MGIYKLITIKTYKSQLLFNLKKLSQFFFLLILITKCLSNIWVKRSELRCLKLQCCGAFCQPSNEGGHYSLPSSEKAVKARLLMQPPVTVGNFTDARLH